MSDTEFRLVVAGTRTFADYALMRRKLDALLAERLRAGEVIVILQGGARGADALAKRYADERGHECLEFEADWQEHGRAAGPIRNRRMAGLGHALAAFWDGSSPGTKDMIEAAREAGLPSRVIRYDLDG